jgi:predicted MFS family arabinose efflux permease
VVRTYREVFAIREFRALFATQLLTMTAIAMSSLALGAITFESTGSTVLTSLAMFGGPVITVVGSATVVGFSDSVGPRLALLTVPTVMLVAFLLQAIPGLPWQARFVVLALPYLANSAVGGSMMRMLTLVVPEGGFVLGRATLNMAIGVMQVLGFGLGGLLLAVLAPPSLFVVAAGCAAVAAVVVRVGLVERPATQPREKVLRRTRQVNRQLLGSSVVRPVYLSLWVPNGVIVGCEALFIPFAGSTGGGYLMSATAAGMLLGDIVVGRVLSPRLREQLVEPLRLLLAIPYLAFFLDPTLPVAMALGFVASAGYSASLVLQERLVHTTDPTVKGQVFGLAVSGLMLGQALGALLGGTIATWLPVPHAMGVLALLSIVVTLSLTPGLRRSNPAALAGQDGQDSSRPG